MKKIIVIGLILAVLTVKVVAQESTDDVGGRGAKAQGMLDNPRIIQTAVPLVNINPESRGGAMGDVGVATSPDVNSMHWNPAKYAFMKDDAGAAISYSPWLRGLGITDINLAYLTAYKRIDNQQTVAASLRYFSLGNILFRNESGGDEGSFTPNEFTIDGAYSRLFSENFSAAIAFRFIRSDLASGSGLDTKPGYSGAADVAAYYKKKINVSDKDALLSFGMNISNMGAKISYNSRDEEFIPTNLRLGTTLNTKIDNYNALSFSIDANKLLVPTPAIYDTSVANQGQVLAGIESKGISVPQGMIQSFYDAPGGYKEELEEIMISLGTEYWYRDQFAVRGGYFGEAANKGNRKYYTLGVGLKMNVFNIDFSYLIAAEGRNNPLANTMRFSLSWNFAKANNVRNKP